jgi:RNA polymerase sigma-70 factor, ECF subfamily
VRSAQGGDRAAFGELYESFSVYVYAILISRLPRAIAEDLVQDVFVQAFERLATLREPAAFPGWIAAIARRRAADVFREQRLDQMNDEINSPDARKSAAPSPETQAAASEALAAIRGLPEAYRETLVLRLVQGLTGPEIAVVTGLTPDSVRVNLHRGMKLLRGVLGART